MVLGYAMLSSLVLLMVIAYRKITQKPAKGFFYIQWFAANAIICLIMWALYSYLSSFAYYENNFVEGYDKIIIIFSGVLIPLALYILLFIGFRWIIRLVFTKK